MGKFEKLPTSAKIAQQFIQKKFLIFIFTKTPSIHTAIIQMLSVIFKAKRGIACYKINFPSIIKKIDVFYSSLIIQSMEIIKCFFPAYTRAWQPRNHLVVVFHPLWPKTRLS